MNDIVYFCKMSESNEELTYSLRSAEQNFPHRKVFIYGGKPSNIEPDEFVHCHQVGMKWNRVRDMLRKACDNDDITEDFWLFNDDFFILKKIEQPQNYYHGTLEGIADEIEERYYGRSIYTIRLRELAKLLRREGFETKGYNIHTPMLLNRKKMAEVLDKYPQTPMFRALYGNYWKIGGTEREDCKIRSSFTPLDCLGDMDMLSSSDDTWMRPVGAFIRERFPNPSRFEK